MSGSFQHSRTRSQSRFPTFIDRGDGGAPTLEKTAHRSKSFDNRRDFSGPFSYETPSYLPRSNNLMNMNRGTRESFFNDSITIPIKKTSTTGQPSENNASNNNTSKIKPANLRQYQSAIEGLDAAKNDNDWTSYDKSVRYNHQRTEFPPSTAPRQQNYEEYRQHVEPPTSTYVMRHPEVEYNNQTHQQKQQQNYQNSQNYQQNQSSQHYKSSHRQRHSDYGHNFDAPVFRTYYDEDYGGASTYGRAPGVSNGGNGYRYQHHESSHHRENGANNGGGDLRGVNSRYYSNQNYSNYGPYKNYYNATTFDDVDFGKKIHQKRPIFHHKIHCCCFSFKWPPWGYEPCEPPTPIFYNQKNFKSPIQLNPYLSPRQQNKRFISPESSHLNANQHLSPLHSTPNNLSHGLPPPHLTTQNDRLTPPQNLQY